MPYSTPARMRANCERGISVVGDTFERCMENPAVSKSVVPHTGDQGFESIFLQRVGQGTLAFRAGVLGCVLVLCGANFRLNASTR
jgi:hypothetical protein